MLSFRASASAPPQPDAWILTASGVEFDLINPTPDMVRIEDIAVALSRIARFNGHTSRFYSVAEHSIIGANLIGQSHDGGELALEFLLHDAHEAYVGDLCRPLKALCPDFQAVEDRIDQVIRQRFGLRRTIPAEVKRLDRMMLAQEWYELMPKRGQGGRPLDFAATKQISSLRNHYFGTDLVGDFIEKFNELRESIAAETVLQRID